MPSLLFQCYSKIFLEEMVLFGPTVLFCSDFTGNNCRFLTHFQHISTGLHGSMSQAKETMGQVWEAGAGSELGQLL